MVRQPCLLMSLITQLWKRLMSAVSIQVSGQKSHLFLSMETDEIEQIIIINYGLLTKPIIVQEKMKPIIIVTLISCARHWMHLPV